MAGYIFFVLGVLILQSATFASSVSPDGRALLPRSLLHGRFLLQACTDPCATGEAYKLSPEGEVIAPCTCFQVIVIEATLPDMTVGFNDTASQEQFLASLEELFRDTLTDDVLPAVNTSSVVDGVGLTVQIFLFDPTNQVKFTNVHLARFQEDVASAPWNLDSPFGTFEVSNYTLPDGGGEGIDITPTPQSPTVDPHRDAANRGYDEGEGELERHNLRHYWRYLRDPLFVRDYPRLHQVPESSEGEASDRADHSHVDITLLSAY